MGKKLKVGMLVMLAVGMMVSGVYALGTNVAIFKDLVLFDGGISTQAFTLSTRAVPTSFPVPVFRPNTSNTAIAFDIMPNGNSVSEVGNNGYAWFDACDKDLLLGTGTMPVSCARVGIRSDRVEFGSRAFDSGPVRKVSIAIQGTSYIEVSSTGQISFLNLVTAADNAAATTAGVPVDGIYKTSTGELRIRY